VPREEENKAPQKQKQKKNYLRKLKENEKYHL